MSEISFSKYQAAGNDFVLVDDPEDRRPLSPEAVRRLCDRRLGVGADGLIRVGRRDGVFAMELTNADGSSAEMSGNGMRCLAAFVCDRGLQTEDRFRVVTAAGSKEVSVERENGHVARATVAMGTPGFTKAAIPMRGPAWETFLMQPFEIGEGLTVTASAVSMGNPHLVLFVEEDPARYHVAHIGAALERHDLFPERTNVEFARITPSGIDVRVWERGVGETLACGTGACAVAVAANEAGLAPARVDVTFPGGVLQVERREDGEVLLGGPAAHVFDGTVEMDLQTRDRRGRRQGDSPR